MEHCALEIKILTLENFYMTLGIFGPRVIDSWVSDARGILCELRRYKFMKNRVQIYVPKRPRTYDKHVLNLLKSSIPDIFTSTLTIFSVETLEKLCQTM